MAKSRFGISKDQQAPWTPKYPEFATETRETALLPDAESAGYGGQWFPAPETSHVAKFALYDNRNDIMVKYRGAIIDVQFKEPIKTGQSIYRYYFDRNFAEARRVFDLLKNAEHPGEIVQSELIAKRVRYEPYG